MSADDGESTRVWIVFVQSDLQTRERGFSDGVERERSPHCEVCSDGTWERRDESGVVHSAHMSGYGVEIVTRDVHALVASEQ